MGLLETLVSIVLVISSLFTSQNPSTELISLETGVSEVSEPQKIVIYNYSTVTYSSPFAFNYSEILFGNMYTITQSLSKEPTNIIQKDLIQKGGTEENKVNTFSFDWIIDTERQCNLPNDAKIEIIADKTYTMKKERSELKILQTNCEDCDITVKLVEYPKSVEDTKKLIDSGKIDYTLHKNKIKLLWKYSKTISCVKNLI